MNLRLAALFDVSAIVKMALIMRHFYFSLDIALNGYSY
jgi:hypothetical protein